MARVGVMKSNLKPSNTKDLVHELELHQIELEIQNRELQESYRLLEESRNRHLDLYDRAPLGYLTFNNKGVIQECNLKAAVLLQTEILRLKGQLFQRWIHPDDRRLFSEHLFLCGRESGGVSTTTELHLLPSIGKKDVLVQLHTVSVIDPMTRVKTFRSAVVDITDRKRAEAAEAATRSKSVFLANMSHEIRTPLGAMLGFIELVKNPDLSPEKRGRYLSVVERNGAILSRLIDDILDLSKVEADCMEVEKVEFSLFSLLSETSELLDLKAKEKGLSFKVIQNSAVDRVISDPTRLKQILLNIVGNAIKFTDKGEVTITVESKKTSSGKQRLIFTVKDTGVGVALSQRNRLFQNFSQADCSTTRQFGGTGLGLVLSRKLARAMGGDVSLEKSEVQTGSSFVVSIDVEVPTSVSWEESPLGSTREKERTSQQLKGVRVLVVEDSPDNQMLIEHLLNESGAQVEFADNGKEGVASAMSHDFDLVLMDVQMPMMDGHEATRSLRDQGYAVPIIALSAHAMKEDREKSLNAGCNGHLTKPINPGLLTDTVRRYANLHFGS